MTLSPSCLISNRAVYFFRFLFCRSYDSPHTLYLLPRPLHHHHLPLSHHNYSLTITSPLQPYHLITTTFIKTSPPCPKYQFIFSPFLSTHYYHCSLHPLFPPTTTMTVQKKVERVTGLTPSMPLRCDQKPPALTADALQLGADFKSSSSAIDPSADLSRILNQLLQSVSSSCMLCTVVMCCLYLVSCGFLFERCVNH